MYEVYSSDWNNICICYGPSKNSTIYPIRRTRSMKVGYPWQQLGSLHQKDICIKFASCIAYNNRTVTFTGCIRTLPRATSTATEGISIWSSTNLYTSTSCIEHKSDSLRYDLDSTQSY